MHMAHQDACASGFFGLFAEETTVHIELGDTRRLKALLAAFKKIPQPGRGDEAARVPFGWASTLGGHIYVSFVCQDQVAQSE